MRVLVTGATGYIGGRLVPRLLQRNVEVRALVRDRERVGGRPWVGAIEIVEGDLLRDVPIEKAFEGVDAAYYLVHAMAAGPDFERRDRLAAERFVNAARDAGSPRTIYLGGLVPGAEHVSAHLVSRAEVGAILRAGLPTLEFRAGPVIGSGSASFEMVRYLTERLPAMIAPRWVRHAVQPIGVRDLLDYLVQALDREETGIVEVGADRPTFRGMMTGYAAERGLHRWIVPVPVLAPSLAARWVGFVTPIPNALAVPLVQGVVHPVLADTTRARALFPAIDPAPYREAVRLALDEVRTGDVETRWSGALGREATYRLDDREGLIREVRSVVVDAVPVDVFRTFTSLGGERGWRTMNWAWQIRGLLDRVVGGPGLRRGRRDSDELLAGEALDFWRVERVEPPSVLRLRAEMRLPGRAWLQFEAIPESDGRTRLVQTASFLPRGLGGVLYWYTLYPFHRLIFARMVRALGAEAEARAGR